MACANADRGILEDARFRIKLNLNFDDDEMGCSELAELGETTTVRSTVESTPDDVTDWDLNSIVEIDEST